MLGNNSLANIENNYQALCVVLVSNLSASCGLRYETSAHMWLVLEYCVGGDLRTLLQQVLLLVVQLSY